MTLKLSHRFICEKSRLFLLLEKLLIECISRLRRDEEKGSGKTVKCETKRAGRGNAKHLRSRGPEAGPKAIPHLRSGLWQCNHLWLNLGRPRSKAGTKVMKMGTQFGQAHISDAVEIGIV